MRDFFTVWFAFLQENLLLVMSFLRACFELWQETVLKVLSDNMDFF